MNNELSTGKLNHRPHIVHILGTVGFGGAQKKVLELAMSSELQDYKHSIICIIDQQGEMLQAFERNEVSIYFCPIHWPVSTAIPSYRINRWLRNNLVFTFPWRLAVLLLRLDADLVHTHVTTPDIHLQAKSILNILHLPWIWTLHGLYRSRGEDVTKWPEVIKAINSAPATAVSGVSHAALGEIIPISNLLPQKAHVIYNGIDLVKFNPRDTPDPHFRRQWGIPPDVLLFGTAGRLIDLKRMDVFINAAVSFISKGKKAHFVIAGEGLLREKLIASIAQAGLQDQIRLVGYQEDIRVFMNALDVFILCSDSEGLSNVLLEACAMQLPCIATAVGGIPEIMSGNCLLIPPGSTTALEQAMEQMEYPDTRKLFARLGRLMAEKHSNETMFREYSNLYQDVIKKNENKYIPELIFKLE